MKLRSIFLLAGLMLVLSACTLADDITPPPGYQSPVPPQPTAGLAAPASPPDVAAGAVIYAEKCAPCHGASGLGDGSQAAKLPKKPTALGDPAIAQAAVAANWYNVVTKGRIENFMPPFTSLSDQQRWDVVAYALSLSGTAAPETTATAGAPVAAETSSAPLETPGAMGVISGKITNASGTSLPASLKVVLHVFSHDPTSNQFSELSTQDTTVDSAGKYSFADLAMPTNYAYFISVDHGGTTYSSAPVVPAADVKTYDLPLEIYDTTSDLSVLTASQVHIILDYSKPDLIQVVEFYAITNTSTKTVIPASKGAPLVKVTLPKGYTNLQFQDGILGERFVATADGFADTSAIPPSKEQFQIIFAFDLPYSANFDFVSPFSLNVASTAFLVSEGVKAQAPGILDGGLKDMGEDGGKYQLYNVGSYKTGDTMTIKVSGAPSKSAPAATPVSGADSSFYITIGVGTLGLALMLTGAWLFWRDRKRASVRQLAPALSDDAGMSRDELIDAIIALDDQYNAGNIAQDPYQKRRAELKEKFQEVE